MPLDVISYSLAKRKAEKFTQLRDTPSSYEGYASKFVIVKDDETGLTFGGTLSDLTIDADKDWLGYIIYNAGGFIVQPKSFNKGYTWKVPAGYVLTYVLPPGGELSGTDTIQGDGDFIGFEL